jgi:hypothetical protein
LKWFERFLHILVPLAATLVALYPELLGQPIGIDSLLRLILGLVAGIAIASSLERYVTLAEIEEHVGVISELSNIELLRSAREAGVVDLYPRADDDRIQSIIEAIKRASGPLDICGVALPSMVVNDEFREAVIEHSQKDDIRIMLLNPDSEEAVRRATIEAPLGRMTVGDIISTKEWILKQQMENKRFRLHFYDLPPMLSLIITDQFVFEEPYHFGRPVGMEGCIGGQVPMLKIRNQPELGYKNPYSYFKAHFEYVWNFTRGSRVNLPIMIIEAKASSYIVLENQTSDILMSGWEISGQASRRPYQFEPKFIWKSGERIVLVQESDHVPQYDRVIQAYGDFLGNNTILRLINAKGTLVTEWSMPI